MVVLSCNTQGVSKWVKWEGPGVTEEREEQNLMNKKQASEKDEGCRNERKQGGESYLNSVIQPKSANLIETSSSN